jgi:A/G-specific adenine glycosylase
MLQQTRVEAVRARWERFLERFPSLAELATAPQSEVLAEWAGLGYYRRARQLHEAARSIARNSGGELPREAAALRLLPGFGPYTAGAVASIAFDEPVAAVDGNVERVISRLLALDGDPKRGESAKLIRNAAQLMVEAATPHLVTQGLMELGALVCTPRSPRCDECPWSRGCLARRSGIPESFPRKAPRPETLVVSAYAAVVRQEDRLLWRRRPDGLHNAGLWELPTCDWHPGGPEVREAEARLGQLGEQLGVSWRLGEALVKIHHSITRHRITVLGYEAQLSAPIAAEELRWGGPEEARGWGITAAASKLLTKLPPLL